MEALKQFEEQLTCSVCLEIVTDPKILPCYHSFCLACLKMLPINRENDLSLGLSSMSCPTCRKICTLPNGEVSGLPPAFILNGLKETYYSLLKMQQTTVAPSCDECNAPKADVRCKDCDKSLCQACLDLHDSLEANYQHRSLRIGEVSGIKEPAPAINAGTDKDTTTQVKQCSQHSEPLEMFCNKCIQLICHDCSVKDHKTHDFELLTKAYDRHLKLLDEQIDRIAAAKTVLTRKSDAILEQEDLTIREINDTVAEMKRTLDQTEEKLISEVQTAVKDKYDIVHSQVKLADIALGELTECRDSIGQYKRRGLARNSSRDESAVMSQAKSVVQKVEHASFQPAYDEAGIELWKSKKIPEIPNYMHVSTTGNDEWTEHEEDSSDSTITANFSGSNYYCFVQQQTSIDCFLSSNSGSSAVVPLSHITCCLNEPNGDTRQCLIEECYQSGRYTVTMVPALRGIHQLRVYVRGNELEGVWNMLATIHPRDLSVPCKSIRGMKEPGGVFVTDNGILGVSEFHGHCITLFDQAGKKIRTIGTHGKEKGQVDGPQGLSLTSKGTILVSDFYNNRIQEFSMEGKHIKCAGTRGSGKLQFNQPLGLAIHKGTGKVFVADRQNNRVQVLNPDLTFSHMFGSGGKGKGQFNLVHDLAFDDNGHVYVTDMNNHRIHKFTLSGQFVSTISGRFKYPDGLSLINNLLYISEGRHTFRLSIVTTAGEPVYTHKFGTDSFRRSTIDNHGYFHVCVNEGINVY